MTRIEITTNQECTYFQWCENPFQYYQILLQAILNEEYQNLCYWSFIKQILIVIKKTIENATNLIGKGFVIWNEWKNDCMYLINLKGMKYSYLKTNILEFSYVHNHVFQNSFVFNCKKGITIWMLVNYEKKMEKVPAELSRHSNCAENPISFICFR